ncbi:hypothetical protein P389DRAFT_170256 [Cystobasidium minutum MCA 4210]|uniref:uncharacterized protein n=1 Tax=Cystobasidium minutum MCA 4210 TaxID=1397322 RepID=UPI0034CF96A7|eukprot:jgi/Rhomi1/170256/fgenesh1_kg.3_\
MKAEGPSSRRASNRQMDANNLEEIEVLIGDEQALERASGEDHQTASLPPIMLQSPDSGESVRQCPSNSSLNTTGAVSAANTDSTKTRASLISQFPVYDRRPSDRSSDGGHGGENGAGGAAACPGGSGSTEPQSSENTGSGKTETGGHLFSAPPPRPPSRTRSVPASTLATNIGLGRPPSSPCGPRSPRLTSLPEVMGQAEGQSQRGLLAVSKSSSSVRLERNLSNRSSRTILGAPAWMKGFAWLSPFFEKDSSTFDASEQDLENGETPLSAAQEGKVRPMDRLLPTAAPVMRETPGYRRVTTTAAAYDIQDLRDLSQRPSGPSNTELSEDNGSDDDEHRSFLESPHVRTPPVSVTQAPQGSSRWSRATLGQPLQRISGISSMSLADIRSISESMTSSARARSKSRSRSGSQSESSRLLHGENRSVKSPTSTLSRASSGGTSSHGHTHSSRSRSGSGSEAGPSVRHVNRRPNNSSGGHTGSSSHGSHRSVRSGRTPLRRVQEDLEAVPALPLPKPAAYA